MLIEPKLDVLLLPIPVFDKLKYKFEIFNANMCLWKLLLRSGRNVIGENLVEYKIYHEYTSHFPYQKKKE